MFRLYLEVTFKIINANNTIANNKTLTLPTDN